MQQTTIGSRPMPLDPMNRRRANRPAPGWLQSARRSALLAAACLCLLALPAAAASSGDDAVRVDSLTVSTVTFEQPVRRADATGKAATYPQAVVLLFTGNFPAYRAEPFELYIGDHRVEEYSGNRRHLQIVLLDTSLLTDFEGRELSYRPPGGTLRSLGVAFSQQGLQSLEGKPADP